MDAEARREKRSSFDQISGLPQKVGRSASFFETLCVLKVFPLFSTQECEQQALFEQSC